MSDILLNAEEKMMGVIDNLESNLRQIRTGRASGQMLERVQVEYYGAMTPINQMAAVSVAEARILVIQPWDVSTLKAIEKAILNSDIGITPTNDGKVLRLVFPQLTEERRKDLVKVVHKKAEEYRVVVRNLRRDANDAIKKTEKAKEITEDEAKKGTEKVQKLTDKVMKEIDAAAANKEKEVMEV